MDFSLLSLAEKNIRRKFFRSLAIVLAVTVVATTLFSVTTIMDSVEQSLQRGTARLGADIMVVPAASEAEARATLLAGQPSNFYMDKGVLEKIRRVTGVDTATSQIFLTSAEYQCCDVGNMLLIGFDPETDFTIKPWLSSSLTRPLGGDEIIMGRGITAYQVGDILRLYGLEFKVVGMLEETGMEFIDNSVFLPTAAISRIVANSDKPGVTATPAMTDKVSTVLVQVTPEYPAYRVALFIEAAVDGVRAIETEQIIASVRKQLFVLLRSVLSVSLILWVMSLFLIGVVFSMIVNERKRELGMFRAMGARKGQVFSLIISEASLLSIVGGLLGVGIGGGVLFLFQDAIHAALNVPHLWPSPARFFTLILFCLAFSLITGVAAALAPAIKAAVMEPYEAIRQGE